MVEEVNIKISGEGAKKAKVTTKKKTKAKKSTKKKAAKKKTVSRTSRPRQSHNEKILIENFVSMQKVMTKMAENFDDLSKQISKLLKLFEDSAETLVEKDIKLQLSENGDQEEVLEKLNRVLEQNKIIAKGLTLMHETAVNPTTFYSLAPHPDMLKQNMGPQKPMPKPAPQTMPNRPNAQPPKMTISKEINAEDTFPVPEQNQSGLNRPKVFEEENQFSGF